MNPDPKYLKATGEFIDPVCAMTVRSDGPHHLVHDDHEYRFCSAGCKGKFGADPATYLQRAARTVLVLSMGDMVGGRPMSHLLGSGTRAWLELALATPACLWAARPFLIRAVRSVTNRSLNMFTLIGLGVGVAYGYSLVASFPPQLFPPAFRGHDGAVPVYFEAASVIVTLILLGQVLELCARSQTGAAIRELLALAPVLATRARADGSHEQIGSTQCGLATGCWCGPARRFRWTVSWPKPPAR